MQDKKKLDIIILTALGLKEKDVDELYDVAAKYVSDRTEKSASVKTSKSKQKLSYDESLALIEDRFTEITTYKELIKNISCRSILIPEWKAKFPKDGLGSENLFGIYNVYFRQGNTQKTISFENPHQVNLFEFLNAQLDVKGQKLNIPTEAKECEKVLKIVKPQFETYSKQIKNLLKVNRAQANYVSIYRDLLMGQRN